MFTKPWLALGSKYRTLIWSVKWLGHKVKKQQYTKRRFTLQSYVWSQLSELNLLNPAATHYSGEEDTFAWALQTQCSFWESVWTERQKPVLESWKAKMRLYNCHSSLEEIKLNFQWQSCHLQEKVTLRSRNERLGTSDKIMFIKYL